MKTEDRIMQFIFTMQFGFTLAVAIQDESRPWFVWAFLFGMGSFAYWMPEIGSIAKRFGSRLRRWVDGL